MIFGLLTHYYFLVFAFFTCAFMTLWMFIKKRTDIVKRYVGIMMGAFAASALMWNDLLLDVFFSYRGKGAFNNMLTIKEWFGKARDYFLIIFNSISGIPFWWFGVTCTILFTIYVFCSVRSIRDKKEEEALPSDEEQVNIGRLDERHMMVYHMVFAVLFDAIVVAIVAPHRSDRYIFNLLPAVVLVISFALKVFIEKIFEGRTRIIASVIAGIVALTVVIWGYETRGVNYLYKEYAETKSILKEYTDRPALLVTYKNKRYASCTSSYFLKDFPKTFVIKDGDYSHLGEAVASLSEDTECVACFVSNELDTDSAISGVCEATGCENKGVLADIEGVRVYELGVKKDGSF